MIPVAPVVEALTAVTTPVLPMVATVVSLDVYVVSEGLATRVGDVTGNSTARFTLDPSFFPSNELRVIATPVGGNGRASSGSLNVAPGQTITFTIAPVLRQSSATVR